MNTLQTLITNSEALQNDSMFQAFSKFYGMEQDGQNDYTTGCIQTANALMPALTNLLLKASKEPVKQPTYMTIHKSGNWDDHEQIYLGIIDWEAAVNIAKSQKDATRLCNSKGYDNQGHYFRPA